MHVSSFWSPPSHDDYFVTCRNISFHLEFFQFTQPTPITDSTPNGVELTISTDSGGSWKPIAYYAPIGNAMWTNFDISQNTILFGRRRMFPVMAPSVTKLTWVTACISPTISKVMIRWKQIGALACNDKWVLGDVRVNTPHQEQCLNYFVDEDLRERR